VRPVRILAVLLLFATACKHETKPPDPNAELNAARARLAVLAEATANATYDATYRFVQQSSSASGNIRIRQAPPQYRIDITTKDTASFFSLKTGTVSCSLKKKQKSCFLVARPGEEVPPLFDPGVQRLFRDAVEDLSAHPTDYVVTRVLPSVTPSASATPSRAPLPQGECFLVNRTASASPGTGAGFENGTYCFAEQGVATQIDVASGTLTMIAVGAPPEARAFKPFAKVQKLPNLSPTPTPKK
jgi:hypothetical protein